MLLQDLAGCQVTRKPVTVMKKYSISLPEAMTDISRARLKRPKPTVLPSKRIIDMLNNDNYLLQLEMWQACDCDLFENTIRNPTEPREKWIVEKVKQGPQQKIKMKMKEEEEEKEEEEDEEDEEDDEEGDDVLPVRKGKEKTPPSLYQLPHHQRSVSNLPHRLSTIAEVEEEARRLSLIDEE